MIKKILIKLGVLCDHNFVCISVYVGGTGEKNFLNQCTKCGKTRWVNK